MEPAERFKAELKAMKMLEYYHNNKDKIALRRYKKRLEVVEDVMKRRCLEVKIEEMERKLGIIAFFSW